MPIDGPDRAGCSKTTCSSMHAPHSCTDKTEKRLEPGLQQAWAGSRAGGRPHVWTLPIGGGQWQAAWGRAGSAAAVSVYVSESQSIQAGMSPTSGTHAASASGAAMPRTMRSSSSEGRCTRLHPQGCMPAGQGGRGQPAAGALETRRRHKAGRKEGAPKPLPAGPTGQPPRSSACVAWHCCPPASHLAARGGWPAAALSPPP